MEKSILILGDDNYGYYYGVQSKLEELGIGVADNSNIVTLSDKGVSNHVYFYFRHKQLLNKYKCYAHTKYKPRELLSEISKVYVFGNIEKEFLKTFINESERSGIEVNRIQL